ncbi:hypothetical protein BDB01DRAFT_907365 [Pilobolus umbonatus]|nr:hypothetical protein BDB01DRAFT_907365 [Pilobolus umbonatus]
MNSYNLDDDDPNRQLFNDSSQQLFGHSYDEINGNPFLNYENMYHSSQQFDSSSFQNDTSPSPSSGLGQDYMYSQMGLDDIYSNNAFNGQFYDNQLYHHEDTKVSGSDMFLNMDNMDLHQQAILLSDPNFLRQQQLLQNQHKHKEEDHPVRSNLSAMFNNNNHNYTQIDNTAMNTAINTSINTHMNHQPVKQEYDDIHSKHSMDTHMNPNHTSVKQEYETIRSKHSMNTNTLQQRKDNQQRSPHDKNSKPIPISTTSQSPTTPSSSSVPTEIDHQRRFNELQARFRVNYSKKPQRHSHQPNSVNFGITGTSMPASFGDQSGYSDISSSYTDDITPINTRKPSLELLTTTKPVLRVSRDSNKVKSGNTSTNHMSNHNTTTSSSSNSDAAVNIPSNPSNSTGHIQAASFPSRTIPIQIQRVHRANAFQPFDAEQRQKRLDDQLVKVDFNDITVSELKEMLRQRGKPATGKKAILLQRLQEELEMIKQARVNGKSFNRYSHPLVQNSRSSPIQPQGELSPMMDHAGSLPESMYLSSSPGSTLLSLNRSIADMHIGSPPMTTQQSRRFAPYASSPRTNNTPAIPQHIYSSSVPTNSLDMVMQQTQTCNDIEMSNSRSSSFNFNKKSYAPFTSSALATPDQDKAYNPFDDMKYRDHSMNFNSLPNDMEWTDPSTEQMYQQGLDIPEEQILQMLSQDMYTDNQFMESIDKGMKYDNTGPDLSSVMYEDDSMSGHGKLSRDYPKK